MGQCVLDLKKKIERMEALGATKFEASTNSVDADVWLSLLEKCFQIVGCETHVLE